MNPFRLRPRALLATSLLVPACGMAAPPAPAPPPATPGASQLLKDAPAPVPPPAPMAPDLSIAPAPGNGDSADLTAFPVSEIVITGNTRIPTATLQALVASGQGQTLSLADLNRLAMRITAEYRRQGYLLASAYVPAQSVRDGRVRIDVLEATYGDISFHRHLPLPDRVVEGTLADVRTGEPVLQLKLERALLLLSDLPGTKVIATLKPGTLAGSSDLVIDLDPTPRWTGSAGADDYGNRYTGRLRANATLNGNNPFGLGDQFTLNGTTAGPGLNYARIAYALPVAGVATQLGVHASALDYRLVNGADGLGAHGDAEVIGVSAKYAVMRSTLGNVYAGLDFDQTQLRDRLDASNIRNDRHSDDLTASIGGLLLRDNGSASFNLSLTSGHLGFDDPEAGIADFGGADVQGHFFRYDASVGLLERITTRDTLAGSISAQGANRNLDPSEQFYLGGPNSVRAYDTAIISGAAGALATLEYRHDLETGWPGLWQLTAFADAGHVQVLKNAIVPGANDATLSGFGAGINWSGAGGWLVNASLAAPLGARPTLLGDRPNLRAWLQGQAAF